MKSSMITISVLCLLTQPDSASSPDTVPIFFSSSSSSPVTKSGASQSAFSISSDRPTDHRACSVDDDDALTSLKHLMETILNSTISSSSSSDGRGR